MAYPGSLDSFTTKTDDVTEVLAAHVNDLQTAIVAIETELGTDPAGTKTDLKTRLVQSLSTEGNLKFAAPTTLTISSGDITITQNFHLVDTEAAGASDDLDTINGGADGLVLILRQANDARDVTVKHAIGNIYTTSGADYVLSSSKQALMLIYDNTLSVWIAFDAHAPITVTDTSTIDFTLTGQALTASVIPGGIAHNDLASKQGGTAGEYNHLTNAQVTALHAAAHDINGADHTNTPLGVTKGGTGTATQMTAGSVLFAGAAGVHSQDNGHLFWDSVNKKMGLGTKTPAYKLDIVGNFQIDSPTGAASTTGYIVKNGLRWLHDFNWGNNGTVTTAGYNVFLGSESGNITSGSTATETYHSSYNIGIGRFALSAITAAHSDVAVGHQAMRDTTTGAANVALGYYALLYNTTGANNVAIGQRAGVFQADGGSYLRTAKNSVYIGQQVRGYSNADDNAIVIGGQAIGSGPNQTVLGNTAITKTTVRGDVVTTNGETPAAGITKEGGFWVRMVAGEALYRGEVVASIQGAGGADGKVWKCPTSGNENDMPLGVVYADASANAEVWIVTSGIAYVLPTSGVTATRGYVITASTTTAGRVDQAATVPAAATHFKEVGHWIDTGSGNGALTRAIVHFN